MANLFWLKIKLLTITADDKKEMTIQMEQDAIALQEVVINLLESVTK
jgi:hypothetical protein